MTLLSQDRLRTVLAWVVIVMIAVPVGSAVWLGLVYGESPCILCWAQRTSMVLIALVGLFVLRYGPAAHDDITVLLDDPGGAGDSPARRRGLSRDGGE